MSLGETGPREETRRVDGCVEDVLLERDPEPARREALEVKDLGCKLESSLL